MREYKITEWDLGYHVFRRDSEDLDRIEWLQNTTYTTNRNHSKTFYHLDSAISALVNAKIRWEKTDTDLEENSESIPQKVERQSWDEF